MESFLQLIIFVFPGLITYYWVILFGYTPTNKHGGIEMLVISSLFWIPINICLLITYNLFAYISNQSFKNLPTLHYISNFENLTTLSSNFYFVLFYVILSIFISYKLSRLFTGKFYLFLLDRVNKVRENNGKARFSQNATIWEETFSSNTSQIVGVSQLGSNREVFGVIKNASRPFEERRGLVLEQVYYWQPVMEHYNVSIEYSYIDTNSGTLINIYDSDQAKEAANLYESQTILSLE